jgi:hypothetical protein
MSTGRNYAEDAGEVMGNSAEINQQVYTKVLPDSPRYAVEVAGGELFSVVECRELICRSIIRY